MKRVRVGHKRGTACTKALRHHQLDYLHLCFPQIDESKCLLWKEQRCSVCWMYKEAAVWYSLLRLPQRGKQHAGLKKYIILCKSTSKYKQNRAECWRILRIYWEFWALGQSLKELYLTFLTWKSNCTRSFELKYVTVLWWNTSLLMIILISFQID